MKQNTPKKFTVAEPTTLMSFLLATLSKESRTTIKSLLSNRKILVNNLISTKFDAPLSAGDTISIVEGRTALAFRHPMMRIVFEDDSIIVIDKRQGLLSIGTDKERTKTAQYILSQHVKKSNFDNRIFVVHRLDRETSGLMMFAKSEEIQETLQKNWGDLVVERKYVAAVEGLPREDEGVISAPLAQNKAFKMYVSADGEEAITGVKVLRRGRENALLELSLETGKKNQIRAHLEYVGHPIVGDKKYGAQTNPVSRVCLHAYKLWIKHPVTGESLDFSTRIPPVFESMVK